MVHVVASGMLDKPLLELSRTAVLILSIIINILLSWLAIAIDFFNTSDQACIGKKISNQFNSKWFCLLLHKRYNYPFTNRIFIVCIQTIPQVNEF